MFLIKSIFRILNYQQRIQAIGILGLIVIGSIVETLGIGLIVPLMGILLQEDFRTKNTPLDLLLTYFGNPSQQQVIVGAMAVVICIYLFKSVYLGYLSWKQNNFNTEILVTISRRLFTTYLTQPYSFHLHRNSSELIRNIVNEIGYFLSTGLNAIMVLVTESLVLLGIIILLFATEPLGTVILVFTVGLTCFIFQRLTKIKLVTWGNIRQRHDGLRIKEVQHGLGGIKDAILLGREDDFLHQYDIHNRNQANASRKLTFLQSLPRLWLELMAVFGLGTLVSIMTIQGRSMGSIISAVSLFGAAAFRLLPSVGKILGSIQSAGFGDSVLRMLQTELALETPRHHSTNVDNPFSDRIEACGVKFSYENANTMALNDVSFEIFRGETVGIVGPSGSGKSTLIDVVLGLLQPSEGQILIDGREMLEDIRGWQNQIGYVPQSIFLTDDTLRRNIAFGLPSDQIDETSILRAMKSAQLEDFIQSLPEGLDTIVGERGVRLSGGQRQRIGIARALYHDPAVIVLDEATSALDGSTENEVMDAIHALRGSKTVVIVAHRLSTVESCDRIFRMEDGRLVETGPPGEILHKLSSTSSKTQLDLGLIA